MWLKLWYEALLSSKLATQGVYLQKNKLTRCYRHCAYIYIIILRSSIVKMNSMEINFIDSEIKYSAFVTWCKNSQNLNPLVWGTPWDMEYQRIERFLWWLRFFFHAPREKRESFCAPNKKSRSNEWKISIFHNGKIKVLAPCSMLKHLL